MKSTKSVNNNLHTAYA